MAVQKKKNNNIRSLFRSNKFKKKYFNYSLISNLSVNNIFFKNNKFSLKKKKDLTKKISFF